MRFQLEAEARGSGGSDEVAMRRLFEGEPRRDCAIARRRRDRVGDLEDVGLDVERGAQGLGRGLLGQQVVLLRERSSDGLELPVAEAELPQGLDLLGGRLGEPLDRTLPPIDVAASLGECDGNGVAELVAQARRVSDVPHPHRRFRLPRAKAVRALEPVGDRRDLHRAKPELRVRDVDPVLDDVADLHGCALVRKRDAQKRVRPDGRRAHERIFAVAGPVEALADHAEEHLVVGLGVLVTEDRPSLVSGKAEKGGGFLLDEAPVHAGDLELRRKRADVVRGRADLRAELREGQLAQVQGRAVGPALERDARELHRVPVARAEGPGAKLVDREVVALAVPVVGVEDELGGLVERDGLVVCEPLLGLIGSRYEGYRGRSGALRHVGGLHGDSSGGERRRRSPEGLHGSYHRGAPGIARCPGFQPRHRFCGDLPQRLRRKARQPLARPFLTKWTDFAPLYLAQEPERARTHAVNMSEPRRHHIVPECHLRRFASDRGQVRVVAREDPARSFVTSLENVPVERDFYAVETDDGISQRVETELIAKVESDATPAIDRMLCGTFPPKVEDRINIAAFVALQYLRGWDTRETMSAITEHFGQLTTMNTTRASVRQFYRETQGREATDAEVERHIAFASDPSQYRIVPHKNHLIRQALEMLPGMMRLTIARKWQLMRAQDAAFVTSDAPVTLWSHPRDRHWTSGFGMCEEICIALDRHHALLLTHETPNGEVVQRASDEGVWALNCRTAFSARKWIIHHPDDDPPMERHLPPPRPKFTMGKPFRVVPRGL